MTSAPNVGAQADGPRTLSYGLVDSHAMFINQFASKTGRNRHQQPSNYRDCKGNLQMKSHQRRAIVLQAQIKTYTEDDQGDDIEPRVPIRHFGDDGIRSEERRVGKE